MSYPRHLAAGIVAGLLLNASGAPARAGDLASANGKFLHGQYEEVLQEAAASASDRENREDWLLLQTRCQLALGDASRATAVAAVAVQRFPRSARSLALACEAYRSAGRMDEARRTLAGAGEVIRDELTRSDARAASLVACGQLLQFLGADPREILEKCYDRARALDANEREVYVATGELALDKNDRALAAEAFRGGLKKFPDDPDLLFGLARALAESDHDQAEDSLKRSLAQNPRHVPALLFEAESLIDRNRDADAEPVLAAVLKTAPSNPEAWALRAALAHFAGDEKGQRECREKALAS